MPPADPLTGKTYVHEIRNTPKNSYEPPRIQDLGTLVDLTAGAGTPGADVSGSSTA